MKLKGVFCLVLVLLLCLSVVKTVPAFSSDKIGYLCIIKPGEEEVLKPFKEAKEKEGFEVFVANTDVTGFTSISIRSYILKVMVEHPNLMYGTIPPDSPYEANYYQGIKGYSDMFYCNVLQHKTPKADVYISRATAEMLSFPRKKMSETKVMVGTPPGWFEKVFIDSGGLYYALPTNDESRVGNYCVKEVIKNNWKVAFLTENRGIKPAQYQGIQLNKENVAHEIVDSNYVIFGETGEPVVFDQKKQRAVETNYRNLTTAYWIKDEGRKKSASPDEIVIETVGNIMQLGSSMKENYERIGYITIALMDELEEMKVAKKIPMNYYYQDLFSSLITPMPLYPTLLDKDAKFATSFFDDDDGDGLKPGYTGIVKIMNEALLDGSSTGEALWTSLDVFNDRFPNDPYKWGHAILCFILLGDPTQTVKNTVAKIQPAEIHFQPESLNNNEIQEIVVNWGKETKIVIENIGVEDLKFEIFKVFSISSMFPDLLTISPYNGVVSMNQKVEVILKLEIWEIRSFSRKRENFIMVNIVSNSINFPNKTLRVRISWAKDQRFNANRWFLIICLIFLKI